MNKNKGFGRSTSKYKNQITTIKKLMNIGNFSKAEKLLLSLEAKNQLDHIGFHLLGMIYKLKSDYSIALKLLIKSINLDPLYAQAYSDIGAIYLEIKNISMAIRYLEKSLEIEPKGLSSNINLGLAYRILGKYKISIKYYSQALKINPNNSTLNFKIGELYEKLMDFNKANFFYRKSFSIDPNNRRAIFNSYRLNLKNFDFNSINNINSILSEFGTKFYEGGEPLTLLYYDDDPLKQKLRAELFFKNYFKREVIDIKVKKNKKIKIGYLSYNFVVHPVSFLISKVIEIHNRSEFEIYGYSINPIEDDLTRNFYKSFDSFKNLSKESDDSANKKIREDNLDIIIDLMGYTTGSRMGILSKRVAPIQVSYLAYPATSGSDQIDYIIADKNVIPKDKQKFYTEKVLYLPKTYICFDDSNKISTTYKPKQFINQNQNNFILVGFHKIEKLNLSTVNCWIKIMNKVENSFLWLKRPNKIAEKNILDLFESNNIDSSRIAFAERVELYEEHLARYKLGDLLLDTFIYNGHTTTIESLFAGLPVITLEGNSFASRVSSSILRSIGFDALIAKTKDEYIDKVIFYSKNKNKLNEFKKRLFTLKSKNQLFNTKEFVHNFEKVLKKVKNEAKDNE